MKLIAQATLFLMVTTVISGLFYPAVVTGLGQLFWADKSNGSLIRKGDTVIGSELLSQQFQKPEYFWPRPSASNFSALPSGASNLGPTSAALAEAINTRRSALSSATGMSAQHIPVDLLTASGSGLDPHISVQAAQMQVARIVNARRLGEESKTRIEKLIADLREKPQLGILGEERINVLLLNIGLDRLL